jgi:hypothetical protein
LSNDIQTRSINPPQHAIPALTASAGVESLLVDLNKFLDKAPVKLSDMRPVEDCPNPTSAPAQVSEPATAPLSGIARCNQAYIRARKFAVERRESQYIAEREAEAAYRKAMPPLLGKKNIREFIACVAHGMLMGAINSNEATKLLYAAQVAYSAANQPKNDPKSTSISAPFHPQTQTNQPLTGTEILQKHTPTP